ncbi:cytochrome P450 [Sphingobium sp. HWE2-09]|uniref:cytochrome P450 n=1 Tax=Sphingobium sp. HWE2-09 TaxID=3108390 RepID=UPI002DD06A93|nr:cytochrome P450 [Sphingobium sp. HWE2-09]
MTGSPATSLSEAPILDLDPFSDEVLRDPYPFFEQLLDAGPAAYIPLYDYYAVGRWDEVGQVASDHSRFTSTGGVGMADIRKPGAWRSPSPITEIEGTEHAGVRRALQRILSPRVVREWRERFEDHAQQVAERVLDEREIDGVSDIAEAFVLSAFPGVLGIDAAPDRLVLTGELNFNQLGPNNERLQRCLRRAEPILEWYADQLKRERMLPGGFGIQIFEAEDRGEFASGTAAPHVRSFFRAGTDTTIAGIGHALHLLAINPEQYSLLHADPAKARNAFEEAIRLESPAMVMFRTTTGNVELSGVRLKPDTKVGYYAGAANRDARQWVDPDRYDINRNVAGIHRAFGFGAHICIGQMIARLEAESILNAISIRAKSVELAGEPSYRLVNTLRTLNALPLRIKPR